MSRPCVHCGEELMEGSRFCEACGRVADGAGSEATDPSAASDPASDPAAGPAAGPAAPVLDYSYSPASAPISAPTRINPATASTVEVKRPCLDCGGTVGADDYCMACGTKAPRERDHFREEPSGWVAGVCDRGIVHSRNEDAMTLLATGEPPRDGGRAVLVVLDGVSSSTDSDVASIAGARAAREALRTPLPRGMGTEESRRAAVGKAFADAVAAANEAIIAVTAEDSTSPASATFVAAVVEEDTIWVANIGDSRAYWLPDTGSGVLLTVDDSGAQAQIEAGMDRVTAERSPMAHAITRWLGRDSSDIVPRVGLFRPEGDGWLLVCSDGLWNYASTPDELGARIAEIAAESGTDAAGVEPRVLAAALTAFANRSGGRDNITVAVARLEG